MIIKRLVDIVIATIAMTLLSPALLLLSLLIKISSRGSVFFTQNRPGKNGEIFHIHKFRTMNQHQDQKGNLLPDAKRLTPIGKFMRKFSVDELPELWNVLKGDMSIVGPRPLLVQYLERYTPEQARRHKMKPGITGWAQINGRNAITWEEKFQHDIWYIENWSLWLDLKIILITFFKVIKGEGISQPGHATMEEFKGSDQSS